MHNNVKYLIIGAGISGLAFAYQKKTDDYIILEKDKVTGGLCQSFYDQGFVWDVAGHFFHFHSEKTRLFYERLMADKKMNTVKKCARVYYDGRYIDAPFQYNIHQLPQREFIECLVDLYDAREAEEDCSFERFVRMKYGNGIAEKFLIPYNEKLYACKMNELERESMGSFLPKLDFDMLMDFYRGSKGKTYNDVFSYPVNGCAEMIHALADVLDPERIHLNEGAVSIDLDRKTLLTNKAEYHYEYLISSAPLKAFCRLAGIDAGEHLSGNQVLVLNLGFDRGSIDKKTCWAYYPGDEVFYRVGFYNNIVGTEMLSVYVEIGYKENETIDVDNALQRTLADLERVGVTNGHQLVCYRPYIIDPAYVHITSAGTEYTNHIIKSSEEKHAYHIGRYARWEYSAMDDSIEQAFALSERI